VGQGPGTPVFDPNNGNVYVTNFNSNQSPGNTGSVTSTVSPQNTAITSATDRNGNPVQNGGMTIS
jgi:DNA-binding beta-propeller fold protein YncE